MTVPMPFDPSFTPPPPSWLMQQPEVDKELTEEEKQTAQEIFSGEAKDDSGQPIRACIRCGGIHARVAGLSDDQQPCPRVKRLEWHADGTLHTIEYWPPDGSWEKNVIFPHDVYGD